MGRTRRDRRSFSDADPLWFKAPFVLFHYPGLFVSIAVGALLLALAASAYPLFISASASELVKARIQEVSSTRWAAGMMYRQGTMPLSGSGVHGQTEARVDQLFDHLVAQSPYLAEPVESALAGLVPISAAGHEDTRDTRLFFGEGVESNVEILEGSAGHGALVPDQIADTLGISPGDRVVVGSPAGGTVTLPVDAVYRSLYKGGASDYWMPWKDDLVFYECPRDCPPPPPQALIVPRERFEAAARTVGLDHAAYAWQAPLARDLTLEEAEDAARIDTRISEQIDDSPLLDRCFMAFFCSAPDGATWGSAIDDVVDAVHDRLIAIEGPARLLRAAGILVALVVVAGAGVFAMATRRVESTLLFARGARSTAVGGRAALEALLPCAIGAVAGLALAFASVYGVGPNGALSHDASREALAASGFTGVAAIVAIAAVSTVSFLRHSEHHRRRSAVLGALPWELILIALSLVILERLRRDGAAVADLSPDTEAPSLWLFAFPIAFLAGFVALVARGIVFLLGRARGRSGRWGTPAYLAVHRLAARPRLTMLLITATGLCLGLFLQAQTVARSMATTVGAKAGAYVGSDVQVRINDYNETPSRFPLPLTRVVRRPFAGVLRGTVQFDLLAIDTDTFASAAFWDPSFSSEPLDELVRRLSRPSGGALPVVVASAPQADPSSVTIDARTVPVEMVARADAFPGMLSRRPLVVVDAGRLVDAFEGQANPISGPGVGDELWIRGDPAVVRDALAGLSYRPNLILTADAVKDIAYIAAVIDTFLMMNGLGLLAAILVFAAMLMYLQARQRSEIVSYGLSLRMGMRSSRHLLAISTEIGALLAISYIAGSVLAVVAARLSVLLDPLEAIPPDPISVVPVFLVLAVAPALVLLAFGGGWLTERHARAADLGQVMRLAD
jgi:putative ABC transport system permease protein